MDKLGTDISRDAGAPIAASASNNPVGSTLASQARPHYTPQFSATTQMILKRIKGEPSSQPKNLSSVISSASASENINQSTYEDTRRRLLTTMNTQISLPMPPSVPIPAPAPQQRPTPVLMIPKTEPNQTPAMPPPRGRGRPPKLDKKGKAPRATKRKRGAKYEDDASSALSDPADSEEDDEYLNPTMTKSGRQVSKPAQFTPVTTPGTSKRKNYGKRAEEQALCKVCTRGLSTPKNPVVFCDGCNNCWHQLCHEPIIDDDFIRDENQSWLCRGCVAKKEKQLVKKKAVDGHKGVSWPNKTAEQKRSYLSSLSKDQLINVIMFSLELHPDLPVFSEGTGARRGRPPKGAEVSSLPASPGPTQFLNSVLTPTNGTPSNDGAGRNARANSEEVPLAWPKQGTGALTSLKMNEDDFDGKNDFEPFSVTTYSPRTGDKLIENGMPVTDRGAAA